ncbi:MAG: hypothetical protein RMY30_038755, partial [Nostoc sp. CmiSLP01]|nr:hypothetical protein [Nostoc sp. CmiSLP01]
IEIDMPELDYSTFDTLTEKGLPYSAATEENGFPFGDYLLVSGFLDQAKPELEKAEVYLGLQQPSVIPAIPAAESNTSTSKPAKVTASTSGRGKKKTNEQQQ